MGPSLGFYRQHDDRTAGFSLNHSWSVAGPDGAAAVNLTRLEPVLVYTAPTSTTVALGVELTYDSEGETGRGPVTLRVSQLTLIRGRPHQWGCGARVLRDGRR